MAKLGARLFFVVTANILRPRSTMRFMPAWTVQRKIVLLVRAGRPTWICPRLVRMNTSAEPRAPTDPGRHPAVPRNGVLELRTKGFQDGSFA